MLVKRLPRHFVPRNDTYDGLLVLPSAVPALPMFSIAHYYGCEERSDVAISFITFIDSLGDDAYIVPFSWKTYQSS
jgi:hypothetical protein